MFSSRALFQGGQVTLSELRVTSFCLREWRLGCHSQAYLIFPLCWICLYHRAFKCQKIARLLIHIFTVTIFICRYNFFLMESALKVEAVLYRCDFPASKVLSNQSFYE